MVPEAKQPGFEFHTHTIYRQCITGICSSSQRIVKERFVSHHPIRRNIGLTLSARNLWVPFIKAGRCRYKSQSNILCK